MPYLTVTEAEARKTKQQGQDPKNRETNSAILKQEQRQQCCALRSNAGALSGSPTSTLQQQKPALWAAPVPLCPHCASLVSTKAGWHK